MISTHPTLATTVPPKRAGLLRSRWAAIGAAVAVTLGAGGLTIAGASGSPASSFVAITPERILDTRPGVAIGLDGPFSSPTSRTLQVAGTVPTPGGPSAVVPPGATAVVLNVTAVAPTAPGFISVRPDGAPGAPSTSNLNFQAGDIIPNAVTVALSPTGAIEVTYDAFGAVGPTTDVLIDVTGYYLEGGGTQGPAGPKGDAGPIGPQGPAGTSASSDLLPVAYGRVDYESDPREIAGVGWSGVAVFDDVYHVRLIQLYDSVRLSAVVTPHDCDGSFPSITTYVGDHSVAFGGSELKVRFVDSGGIPRRCSFSFVVHHVEPN